MKIPFFKYDFTDEMAENVLEVLKSGKYIMGEEVSLFEQELAEYYDVEYAIAVGNGSDALYIACEAMDERKWVEVPVYTFIATAEAVVRSDRYVDFADIDPDTLCADTTGITVNLYGNVIRESNAFIQDMAQAFGAPLVCPVGCLSFFPTKTMGCCGDGGAIITNDPEVAEFARRIRIHGAFGKYKYSMHGVNSRLDAVQARILRLRLRNIDNEINCRKIIAQTYGMYLGAVEEIRLPYVDSTFNYYVIMAKDRNALKSHLDEKGIGSMIYYPDTLDRTLLFSDGSGEFPVAEQACAENLALPMHPQLDPETVGEVCDAIKEFYHAT